MPRLSVEAKLVLQAKAKGGILKRKARDFQMYVPHGGFANVKKETVEELIAAGRLLPSVMDDFL
jgi:hypothetical protein